MSCTHSIYCVPCKQHMREYDDPTRDHPLLHALIKHAALLESLVALLDDDPTGELELRTYYGRIWPRWFKEHSGHELVVMDEYGQIDGRCGLYYTCTRCDCRHTCNRPKGHEPPCAKRI